MPRKPLLENIKTIVIKIGTSSITSDGHISREKISKYVSQIARLRGQGYRVALVSSGAISTGAGCLKKTRNNLTIPQKQALASIGQPVLINEYRELFEKDGFRIGQILLTEDDIRNRRRFLNARHTLNSLFEMDVIPVINENDTVVVKEIKIGDNDTLSSHVVDLIDADLLILLSDVDGFYWDLDDPEPVEEIYHITPEMMDRAGDAASDHGTGGMRTKMSSAEHIIRFGEKMIIANADIPDVLIRIMAGEKIGTIFVGKGRTLSSRKRWLSMRKPRGMLVIDDGAVHAIKERKKSLLPSGIISIDGDFNMGDIVGIANCHAELIAQGVVNYNSLELSKIQGKKTSEIRDVLEGNYFDEVIHRDDLIVF